MMRIQLLPILVVLVLSAGCATPKAEMDEATYGVGLVAQLETSLSEFRRIELNSLQARQESLLEQRAALAKVDREAQNTMRARVAAGDKLSGQLFDQVLANTEAFAAGNAAYASAIAKSEADVSGLLVPIPTTRQATSAVQEKLADMGKELSWNVRAAELQALAKAVKDSVDANKEKIHQAEAKTAAASN